LTVESRINEGTTVRLLLPIQREEKNWSKELRLHFAVSFSMLHSLQKTYRPW
jgi:hypothetical protein